MNRNVLFAIAAVVVVGLLAFAVVRSNKRVDAAAVPASPSAPEAGAPTPSTAASAPAPVQFVEQAEAKQLVDAKNVTLLDVRDAESYLVSHIPGALQIPLARVQGEIPYFPRDKMIVAYCTCPADEAAIEAVQILQYGGVQNARVLRGGLQEWTRLGYPTASGMK